MKLRSLIIGLLLSSKICSAQEFTSGNLNFTITSEFTVEVIGKSGSSTEITIPKSVSYNYKNYNVTSIKAKAFQLQFDKLTSINIPSSITNIGNYAFNFTGITTLVIPNGVKHIGAYAFASTSLNHLTLSESIETIGSGAFDLSFLTTVISLKQDPAFLPNDAFSEFEKENNISLIIPLNSSDNYTNKNWTGFMSITENSSLSTKKELKEDNFKNSILIEKNILKIKNKTTIIRNTIYNSSGIKIKSSTQNEIYIGDLAKGVYILKIDSSNGSYSHKFSL
ncbi:leucine-rich repeat domain-containing protein [Wenyingzhuangia sp. IMCC45574]